MTPVQHRTVPGLVGFLTGRLLSRFAHEPICVSHLVRTHGQHWFDHTEVMNVTSDVEGEIGPLLVLIYGPIAAGKSTIARTLAKRLRRVGEQVALVELDEIAEMALPSLPDWSAAHAIFNSVVGQWLATSLTVVVAEGPGSKAEISALIDEVPPQTPVVIVILTSSFETALARARADLSRGISKERAFLSDVFARWAEEMPQMEHDVLIDTGAASVEESVDILLDRVRKALDTAIKHR